MFDNPHPFSYSLIRFFLMENGMANRRFVFICVGCKKGKCFPKENAEAVWKHAKVYRRKEGYSHVDIREAACLGMCAFAGPNILVIDENGQDGAHHLGAKSIDEAREFLDAFMESRVSDKTPAPVLSAGCESCGCGNCE
jgi:hypothetical protein